MAAAAKENLGKIPCPCCGDPVALKRSASGKLSYACQDAGCESTGFADQSSGAARKWLAALPAKPAPAPEKPAKAAPAAQAAPKPAPKVEPSPAPKKTPVNPFSFLGA